MITEEDIEAIIQIAYDLDNEQVVRDYNLENNDYYKEILKRYKIWLKTCEKSLNVN